MNRFPLSNAAASLLRALLARNPADSGRILLIDSRSVDWQSLTFIGERHELRFRVRGPDAQEVFHRLTGGLEDAEFTIPRGIVADVVLLGSPMRESDGSISFGIEALTIDD